MDLDQRVIDTFNSNIDLSMQTLDALAPIITDCGMLMVQSLLSDHKILCCGDGQSGALAQIFAANLLNRFDIERPSLPAIAINADATTITAITSDASFSEIYAGQVRALGQPGDILLFIANNTNSNTALQAIQAAHDREMVVVAVSDQGSSDITSLLTQEDMLLSLPCHQRPRVAEMQLLILNAICDLIDHQLFGSEE